MGSLRVVLFLPLPSMTTNDPLFPLREALKFSPDNIPLRQHIADTLLNRGEAAAAAIEYQQALALAPANLDLKLGLARGLLSGRERFCRVSNYRRFTESR